MHSHVFVWLSLRVKCWNNLVFEHKAVEVSPARRNCLHSMSSLTWPSYFTFWECNPDLMTCLPVQRECLNAFSVINLFLPLGLFLEIFFFSYIHYLVFKCSSESLLSISQCHDFSCAGVLSYFRFSFLYNIFMNLFVFSISIIFSTFVFIVQVTELFTARPTWDLSKWTWFIYLYINYWATHY